MLLAVDANLVLFHNPESSGDCFACQQWNGTGDNPQNSGLVLPHQTEYDEAR
jgi:hypothetical protein